MTSFAGALRERVTLWRETGARDALGADEQDWTLIDTVWASVNLAGQAAPFVGDAASALPEWRVTLRPCAVAVGDRIEWIRGTIDVRGVIDDPRLPDRVVATGVGLR